MTTDHPYDCPECGADLRGIAGPVCPYCRTPKP